MFWVSLIRKHGGSGKQSLGFGASIGPWFLHSTSITLTRGLRMLFAPHGTKATSGSSWLGPVVVRHAIAVENHFSPCFDFAKW